MGIGRCEKIEVADCIVESNSCALKIGTESFGDIRDVRFTRSKIQDQTAASAFSRRDGGMIENVVFSDIEVDCHETARRLLGLR